MDKAIFTYDEEGRECFHIGKNRIRVTEHFPEEGRTLGELLEDLILYAARQKERSARTEP